MEHRKLGFVSYPTRVPSHGTLGHEIAHFGVSLHRVDGIVSWHLDVYFVGGHETGTQVALLSVSTSE